MTRPLRYAKGAAPANISYTWTDLASGVGYQTYYVAGSYNTTASNILTSSQIYTDSDIPEIHAYASPIAATYTKYIDKDFDVQFQSPRILPANSKVIASFNACLRTGGAATYHYFNVLKLYKLGTDGATETHIVTASGAKIVDAACAANTDYFRVCTIEMPILADTKIKKGEYLRLTVEGWAYEDGGTAATNMAIGYDPKGRTFVSTASAINWTGKITTFTLDVPFKMVL